MFTIYPRDDDKLRNHWQIDRQTQQFRLMALSERARENSAPGESFRRDVIERNSNLKTEDVYVREKGSRSEN